MLMRALIPERLRALVSPKERLRIALNGFEVPNFPSIVSDALDALRDENAHLGRIGEGLAQDPKVCLTLLKHVNSAAFGLRNPVNSVAHAVSLLGRVQLESTLIAVGIDAALPSKRSPGFRPDEFWKGARRRAFVAGELAAVAHPRTRGETATAALLQDMAVPALAFARKEYGAVLRQSRSDRSQSLAKFEQDSLGVDHAEVGGWLCEMWNVPEQLATSISHHHDDNVSDAPFPAAAVVACLGTRAHADDHERIVESARDVLSLSPEETASVLAVAGVKA